MSIFLAFRSKREDELDWVENPVVISNSTRIEFTTTSANVVLFGSKLRKCYTPMDYTELGKIELSRLGVAYTTVLSNIKTGVCIHGCFASIPFIVSGPFPYRLLPLCNGERVDGPNGLYISYGG